MKKKSILIILAAGIINITFARQAIPTAKNSLTVVFYNVENLFDTSNMESWQIFDQVIVFKPVLLKGTGYYVNYCHNYTAGVSDHLPVFVIMQTDKK